LGWWPRFWGVRHPGDWDGDGVANESDDCPVIFDPPLVDSSAQLDSDDDGAGDVCDFCPTSSAANGCGEALVTDLSLTLDVPPVVGVDVPTKFFLKVANGGVEPGSARVVAPMLAELADVSWTCSASVGSSCTASGAGALDAEVSLIPGGHATFVLIARHTAPNAPAGSVFLHTAAAWIARNLGDPNPANNFAAAGVTVSATYLFADGFESGDTAHWW
jgi:hypothetical protein